MKKLLLVFLFLPYANFSFSQSDSIKAYVGGFVHTGIQLMDYSELHQYAYLLNRPPNTSIKTDAGLMAGVHDKFIFSAAIGYSAFFEGITLNGQKTGIYNGYKISVNGFYTSYGFSFFYNVLQKKSCKFLHAVYPNVGIQFMKASISSKAQGHGTLNADTTFYYEFGHAQSSLLNLGIMLELPQLIKKRFDFHNAIPLTISTGYTVQLQDPKWTYSTPPAITTDPRKVNQGGFYFQIGYNIWFYKGMFKEKK